MTVVFLQKTTIETSGDGRKIINRDRTMAKSIVRVCQLLIERIGLIRLSLLIFFAKFRITTKISKK